MDPKSSSQVPGWKRRLFPGRWFLFMGLPGVILTGKGEGESGAGGFAEYRPEVAREYLGSVAVMLRDQAGDDAESLFLLARIRGQLGETDEAMRLAREALDRDRSRADVHAFLAGLLIHEDRMEEAAVYLREAVRLSPGKTEQHRQLGMVQDRLGDRTGARSEFERAVELNPNDPLARMLLGRLLLDLGETGEAVPHLRRALELDPEQAGALYALSEAQRRSGDQEAARESLEQFRALKQREREAYDDKNRTYDDAAYMRRVVAGLHVEAAGLLVRQHRTTLAEQHLRQAMKIAPQEAPAPEMLATLLLRTGRLNEARDLCEALVRLNPTQVAYRVNLGTVLLQLKEYPAGVQELKRALELDPRRPEVLNNLARFYLGARRDLPTALEMSQRLTQLAPTAANYDLLGWALFANGYTNEARAAAAQAVERDPDNAVYRERLQKLGTNP